VYRASEEHGSPQMRGPRQFARSHRGFRVWPTATALCLLSIFASSTKAQSNAPGEYQMKAAFLFHFAEFVEWPAEAFQELNGPLTYCIVGDDPFRGALDESLRGKRVGLHPLRVEHLKVSEPVQRCHVVFLGPTESKRLPEVLASVAGNPVLTVGDSESFVKGGGMIAFCLEGTKMRFEINLAAANTAKLKISARLLALAKTIVGDPRGN